MLKGLNICKIFDKSNLDSNKDKMAEVLHIFNAWMSKGILSPKRLQIHTLLVFFAEVSKDS